jgi:predicted nucleotidyltransferase component of viral defense system
MTLELLNKAQLQIINRRSLRYPLDVAEKDYFLALVSKILNESGLKDTLVFKGGTALYHTYLPQMRFSEDLDFTATSSVTLEDLSSVFAAHRFLELKESHVSAYTIKIKRLKYTGPLGMPNSLKVEVDVAQNVVLPSCDRVYQNVYKVNARVKVMDLREILAEKIRAASDRARYRDFYDIAMILKNHPLDREEILDLVRRKEIRETISHASILQNWEIAKQEKGRGVDLVVYIRELSEDEILGAIKAFGPFEISRPQQDSSERE